MEKLVAKWLRCAQRTAERVFVTARNRIDRMGGYRDFIINQKQRSIAFDNDQQQQAKSMEQQEQQEEVVDEEEAIEEEFTMQIMLRMAGVDEQLIGWDQELNNFVKG